MAADTSQPDSRRKILVFGDWVVDDYWIMGIHRSPTASRTGRAHYRSLHPLDACVRTLCGAGETASVLHEIFQIVGVGMWHREDGDAVRQLIDHPVTDELNPFRLTTATPPAAAPDAHACQMINLAEHLAEFLRGDSAKDLPHRNDYKGAGTPRTIRIFQNTGTRIELLQRIDWELPAPFNAQEEAHAWFPDPELYGSDATNQAYRAAAHALQAGLPRLDALQDVSAVIVKDLGKGCVSSATVRWIREQVRDGVPWFVSSKAWRPRWFEQLPAGSLALLMVPQVAARTAVYRNEVRRWLTPSGLPTREAIACIDDLCAGLGVGRDRTLVAVLPEKQQGIFVGPFTGEHDCHVQHREEPLDLDFEVAMASVLLPALVAELLQSPDAPRISPDRVKAASSFTDEWMHCEVQRIEATEDRGVDPVADAGAAAEPARPGRLILQSGKDYPQAGAWHSLKWKVERDRWITALKDMGILEKDGEAVIELARAMTVLDGYVCLVRHKQDIVQRVIREVRRFLRARERSHVSMLVTASPGSGKSALIDGLVRAERQKLASYTINVAQLAGRPGVIDEFDTVATLQAQSRETPLLVFVDEINSLLDSQHVYDLFLSAMQNGEYVRGGNRFRLDPCIWVFAGTAKPNTDPATKGTDFESRLTVAPLSLDPPDVGTSPQRLDTDAEIRLERVYMGVAILTSKFPDVRRVTRKVLRLFHSLPINCTLRDLVKLISAFENVQLGKVHSGNVSKDGFAQIEGIVGFDFGEWSQHDEDGFVRIVAR